MATSTTGAWVERPKNTIDTNEILNHTHTIEIPSQNIQFYCPDYTKGSLIYGSADTMYRIYTTPCKGFLRFFADSGYCITLLTHSISLFDNKISLYNNDIAYSKGNLVKYSTKYYQCISATTVGKNHTPELAKYWIEIPKEFPVIMHSCTSNTGGDDSGFNSLIIPIEKDINIAVITFGDVSGQFINDSYSTGQIGFSIMFIPLNGNSQQLTDTTLRISKGFRYDAYHGCLAGLF